MLAEDGHHDSGTAGCLELDVGDTHGPLVAEADSPCCSLTISPRKPKYSDVAGTQTETPPCRRSACTNCEP